VRAHGSLDEMLAHEQLDAVLLAVSPLSHPALAIAAFRAGVHVWMEKPAAATVTDIDAMIQSRGDRIAVVGYKKAFMPATTKVAELVRTHQLVSVRTALAVYPLSVPLGDRAYINARNQSLWLANGCHPLSFLVTIAGPVRAVTTHRGRDDCGLVMLRHANGIISNLHLALGAAPSQPFERYIVFGEERTVEVENSRRVRFQRGVPFGPDTMTFAPPGLESGAITWEAQDSMSTLECRSDATQGIQDGLDHFLTCVLAERAPEIGTLEFARHLTQLHEAAILSDERPVEIRV
jgi:predicted dehydrogenase